MIVRIEDIKRCRNAASVINENDAEPEVRFLLASLAEGIYCALGVAKAVTKSTRSKKSIQREALDWMKSEADGEGTFEYLCSQLNIEPGYIRRKVRAILNATCAAV